MSDQKPKFPLEQIIEIDEHGNVYDATPKSTVLREPELEGPCVEAARPAELSAACEAEILTRLDRSNPDVCALIAELARVRQERQFILDEDKRRAIVADAAVKAADDAIAQLADLRRKLGELADTTREVMKLIDDGYLIRYQQWHDAAKGAR